MSYDFKFICDCHCHSKWSFDGCEETDNICRQAVRLGIDVITITDHCEANGWSNPQDSEFGDFQTLIPQSVIHMKESQKSFANQVKLLRGIELGQAMQDLDAAEKALALDDFDFVLASVHNIRDTQDFYWLKYTQEFAENILYSYFKEVLEVARWNKFDSLAHLTYPLRYITGRENIKINIDSYYSLIDEIFKVLINNNKALEINTSGLRQEIGTTLPDKELLQRYYSLGGRLITIGSDAHKVQDLGKGINQGLHILKDIGFKEYAYFEKHSPVMVRIIEK